MIARLIMVRDHGRFIEPSYACTREFRMILLWLNNLRPSFSRQGTFHWFATVILALILQKRPQGTIQSYMNVFHLDKKYYTNLDDMFRSDAIDLDKLTDNWFNIISNECTPILFRGRRIFITDGVKKPKEGRRMPGVKRLHSDSDTQELSLNKFHFFCLKKGALP